MADRKWITRARWRTESTTAKEFYHGVVVSQNHREFWLEKAGSFIEELPGKKSGSPAKTLYLEVPFYEYGFRIMVFDVTGLADLIPAFADACGWKMKTH